MAGEQNTINIADEPLLLLASSLLDRSWKWCGVFRCRAQQRRHSSVVSGKKKAS
jgi:hypothetical protein